MKPTNGEQSQTIPLKTEDYIGAVNALVDDFGLFDLCAYKNEDFDDPEPKNKWLKKFEERRTKFDKLLRSEASYIKQTHCLMDGEAIIEDDPWFDSDFFDSHTPWTVQIKYMEEVTALEFLDELERVFLHELEELDEEDIINEAELEELDEEDIINEAEVMNETTKMDNDETTKMTTVKLKVLKRILWCLLIAGQPSSIRISSICGFQWNTCSRDEYMRRDRHIVLRFLLPNDERMEIFGCFERKE
jgi:hypothetical protein